MSTILAKKQNTRRSHNPANAKQKNQPSKDDWFWCVRTPVIIQFGVSHLQTGVGAKVGANKDTRKIAHKSTFPWDEGIV